MGQRTVHGYLRSVRQLADFCERSPDKVTEDQLRRFFLHLKNERHFAYGSLRVAYSGIKFFYTRTCKRKWKTLAQMKLQNVKTLPEVLTIEQVHQIIDAVRVPRLATFYWTVYSMGLRLEEALVPASWRYRFATHDGTHPSRQRSEGSLYPAAQLHLENPTRTLDHASQSEVTLSR
ncbi:MAG: site-specific integrase [Pirellulaceae bacterium]